MTQPDKELSDLMLLRERIKCRKDSRYDNQFIELLDILIAMGVRGIQNMESPNRVETPCGDGSHSVAPASDSIGSPTRYTDGTVSREYEEQPVRCEISVVEEITEEMRDSRYNSDYRRGIARALAALRPYLRTTEPVSVKEMAKKLVSWAWYECQPTGDGFGFIDDNSEEIVKAVLDAAGVKYVD